MDRDIIEQSDRDIIKEYLTSKGIMTLAKEFNISEVYVRKICYQGTRTNDKLFLRALDIAITNKKAMSNLSMEIKQKVELLKQA